MKIFEDWLDKVEINDEDTEIEISSHPDNPLKFNEWRRYDSTYLIGLWQGRDIYKPRDCKEYQAKFYELIPGIFRKLRYILDNINSIDSYYFELHIRCELPNDLEVIDGVWVKHEYFYNQNYTHYIKLGINTKEKLSAREYELFINGLFCLVPRNNNNHTWEVSSYIWEKTAGEGDAMFHFLESDNYFNPMNKWTMPNFYELYNLGEKIIRPGEFIKFLQLKNTNHIGRFNRYMMKLLENYYGYSIKTNYECKTIHENAPVTDDIREFVFQRMNLIDLSTVVVNIAILWWQDLSARMRDGERKPILKQIQKAIDDFLKDPELRIIAWHCQRYQNGVHTAVVYFFNKGLVFNGREYMLGFENTCTDSSPLPDKIYTMQAIQMLNYEPKEAAKMVDDRPGTFHMYKKYLKQMTLKKGDCK